MLRRAPTAKPGVVRWIENEVGAVLLVDHVAGKDHLVAKLKADLAPLAADVDRARAGTGIEVEFAGREARKAERRKQRPHWKIFAVRNQVCLVVATDDAAAASKNENAVGRAINMNPVFRRDGDSAGQKPVFRPE